MGKVALPVAALLCAAGLSADPHGTISGVVLSAGSGAPLAGSTVTLSLADGSPLRTVNTDRRGQYVFAGLPAGHYLVKASRPNFATGRYGQRAWNEAGRPVALPAGAGFSADIRLHRLGVITGLVVDENGEGLPNMTVHAVTARARGVIGRVSSAGVSDDRGVFRIVGLKPGRYHVATAPRQMEDGTGLLPTYYPGVLSLAESAAVAVEIGQETSGLRIRPIAGSLVRLSGTVVGAGQQATVSLLREEDVRQTAAAPGGHFQFAGVVPGRYTLVAEVAAGEAKLASYQPIELYGDLDGVYLNPSPAPEVSVRIVDEAGAEVSDPQFVVFLARIENGARTPPVRVDGRRVEGLMPGRWRFFVVGPESHVVESITVDDKDALDGFSLLPGRRMGATIRMSRRVGVARGVVSDGEGQPVGGVPVVCYPVDEKNRNRLGGFRTARTDLAGRYRVAGLAEGEYLIVATSIEEFDPEERWEELKGRVAVVKVAASGDVAHDLRILETAP